MVHVASIAGYMPQGYSGAYSVAKAGIRMLSQNLAIELGEFNIRSNVVSPAMIITPLSEAFYKDPDMKARRERMVPQRRIGAPQDIADAIVWFASDRASYVNGEELLVDGGLQRNLLTQIPRPGFEK
jgi:NAD(P)-dependent dehydrogenase (short-subunit alcohol dehydrogenase family)